MTRGKDLKIFKKKSIEYLKKFYFKGVNYGSELKIFKSPSIVGLKLIYHRSVSYLFDNYNLNSKLAPAAEDNFLLRDLTNSKVQTEENEDDLKIFHFPGIDYLKSLYFKKDK